MWKREAVLTSFLQITPKLRGKLKISIGGGKFLFNAFRAHLYFSCSVKIQLQPLQLLGIHQKLLKQEMYDLVLVEGSYGPQHLLEAVPIALVVYIETPLLLRLMKRLWRDVRDRHRPVSYVIRQMLREMLPGERRFIHPLKRRADLVVRGYNFDLEPILSRIG